MNRPALLLSALLLVSLGALSGAAPVRVQLSVSVAEAARGPLLDEKALLPGIVSFAGRQWPGLLEIGSAGDVDARVQVSVARSGRTVTAVSELVPRAGSRRSLRAAVPADSVASLVPTLAGDVAWLSLAGREFAGLAAGSPPALLASLDTDSLAPLVGGGTGSLEPLGIASSPEGVTILLPQRWLTLGPLFRITADTVRDLLLQPSPATAAWTSIARSSRGGITLGTGDGDIVEVDPLLGTRRMSTSNPGGGVVGPSDTDAEGNRWTWDALERRVRVTGLHGREIFSIRPLVRSSVLPIPQAIAVTPDGGLLIGGSGELWKFSDTGVPAWRLDRLPGLPAESLPASFALAANRLTGGFWLLDGPSRRLLEFGPDRGSVRSVPGPNAAAEAALSSHLSGMDVRAPADLARAFTLAIAAGTPLTSSRFASRLQRIGSADAPAAAAAAELAILRDQAQAAAKLVEMLAGSLLYDRAALAAQLAVEMARSVRDREPGDQQAAQLLDALVARRRELREVSAAKTEAPDLRATASASWSPLGRVFAVRVVVQGPAAGDLSNLRLSLGVPGWTAVPATTELDSVASGQSRAVDLELALEEAGDRSAAVPEAVAVAALVSWHRGVEVRTQSFLRQAAVTVPADAEIGYLEHLARTPDPWVAAAAFALVPEEEEPAARSLLALDRLARLSAAALLEVRARASPTPAADLPSPRAILRSLPANAMQWNVLAASVLAAAGRPVGLLPLLDGLVLLLDTNLPIDSTLAEAGLSAKRSSLLRSVCRKDTLCVPVAWPGTVGDQATFEAGLPGAVIEGIRLLSGAAAEAATRARWILPGRAAAAAGVGRVLPVVLPALSPVSPRATLLVAILRSLER